jgi:hypothetical protein
VDEFLGLDVALEVSSDERGVARDQRLGIGQLAVHAHLVARVVEERAARRALLEVRDGTRPRDLVELPVDQAGEVQLELDAQLLQVVDPPFRAVRLHRASSFASAASASIHSSSSPCCRAGAGSLAGRRSGGRPSKTLRIERWIFRRARKITIFSSPA